MTKTLNFRVVSLFLKGGDVEAAKTAHRYPVLAGNQQLAALSVRPDCGASRRLM